MSVRILQFGTTGQLARELLAQAKDFDVEIATLSRAEADFADPKAVVAQLKAHPADLVVLAAAYTAVDQAESDRELAFTVNAETPGAIARALGADGPALVQISTDYVFAGDKGAPYVEDDATGPLNVYGASKLAGEQAILAACPRALILRTSWVVSSHGKNFVKTMLRAAGEGRTLKVVDDQFGRPTAARDLAGFILAQAGRLAAAKAGDPVFGVHHFANAGEVTWKGFADGIFQIALGKDAPLVASGATADWPAPARRPVRGTLDTGKLETTFGVRLRPWREPLAEIVAELAEKRSAA
ncbi:MAG TPA: dTDP-4-dehydrorhamnose reductase [Phenylobacterium sp.]|jgi:dTDP-4-dehydrorhamnose reductase|uniref:dTDP-4-dehydrorhamnose reductase n=1 Tax=Phenylobacterium sp. TaxID=1871053 RepID=UPI002D4EF883|nr:dTDP-4-dehydrorhamnose reductase [Phenylobacterium sp.]HZZ66580.1 dTDP-4-dehydrorhamnose reductase [Phenylobacterium sp.]